jgi:hypothetical protein
MASPVVFLRNVGLPSAATTGQTSSVGEPSVATQGSDIFFTGNWYGSRSADDGTNWQFVDPFSALPPVDGGFCCDQTVIFATARSMPVWLLQYVNDNVRNTLRIAVHPGAGLDTAGWIFWDLTPAGVDPSFAGEWFDYNHAAVTDRFLYVGTNVFTIADDTFTRSLVFRIPLDSLQDGQPLTFEFFESTDNFSLRCAQGATDTMHIVSHNTLSQVRVFSWPENGTSITATDVDVTSWLAGDYSAPGPDGRNWLGRCDPRITGVWVANGQIGIMWTANRKPPARPLPFVRVVRLDETTKTLVDEPDIWNGQFAYAYPDAYPNANSDVGMTVFRGGGPHHPGHVVGFRQEPEAVWRLRVTRSGTHSPNDGKWGDYLTCRRHAPDADTWIAAGYTLQGGGNRQNIQPRYVHFERGPGN